MSEHFIILKTTIKISNEHFHKMSDRYCMCHPHAIKHEDDTHKSLMLFKKWYQY